MPVLALWRMSLLRLLRLPWLWGIWLLLLLAVPFLLSLASEQEALEVARAWAFPAGLLGAVLAVAGLEARAAFLQRVGRLERWAGEWGACLLAPLFLQLPTILGVLLVRQPAALDLARALADILCADLHLAGLALLSLTLPMPANARPLSLVALAWVVPALFEHTPNVRALLVALQPGAPLRDPSAFPASFALGLGLALAVALWRTRPNRVAPR
jgi:hypothetical protein